MYFCFSSTHPAVVKIDGIYFGNVYLEPKSCNFDDSHLPFIEICPLNGCSTGMNFFPNEEFLSNPPESVSVTNLKGGYLINLFNPPTKKEFTVIAQEKSPYLVVTVFSENGDKLSIETPNGFYSETFPFCVHSAEIRSINLDGKDFLLIVCHLDDGQFINVYDLDGKTIKLFGKEVSDFKTDGQFTTTIYYRDVAKHCVCSTWEYKNGKINEKSRSVTCSDNFDKDKLACEIIPYAFLEELLVGGDVDCFLTGSIMENKNKLKGFFGDFIGVFPPPVFRSFNEIGLIYRKGNNRYSVEYFVFGLDGKKINSIKKV